MNYLESGNVTRRADAVDLKVTKFSDMNENFFPFFEKQHPILGIKSKDFDSLFKITNEK